MNSALPKPKQNHALPSRFTRIADKLTRLSTTPPLEYSHKRKKPGVVAGDTTPLLVLCNFVHLLLKLV